MALLYNLAKMTTATTGTGTITLGSAEPGYLTFAGAGVTDGQIVSYGIQDGTNSEVGIGAYTTSGTTLTRTVTNSTNGGSAINLSGGAFVYITALAADILNPTQTANQTLAGPLTTVASATGGAGLNLPAGAAPTSPSNGDVWTTSAGIYVRINGTTVGPLIDSGGVPAAGFTLGTPVATTSGTAFDFTGIPSTAKHIVVMFGAVSLSGTDNILVQIGPSGGVETSGYLSNSLNSASGSNTNSTAGFNIRTTDAATTVRGLMMIALQNSSTNTWVSSHSIGASGSLVFIGGGTVPLSGVLTQVRVTRSGTDTFDAGNLNIAYI